DEADVGEGIDQAGIDGESFAVDDPGFLREVHVFADGGDDAVRDDDGAVFDARTGDRNDRGATDSEGLRLASLRGGALWIGDAQQRGDRERGGECWSQCGGK